MRTGGGGGGGGEEEGICLHNLWRHREGRSIFHIIFCGHISLGATAQSLHYCQGYRNVYLPWCRREKSRVCSADDG